MNRRTLRATGIVLTGMLLAGDPVSMSSGSWNGKQQPERRRFACSGRLSGCKQ